MASVGPGIEGVDKGLSKCSRIKSTVRGHRLQKDKSAISIMCLIARFLAEMVVPFHRSLESDDASWEFGTELVEIVNPVGSKRSGVADELAPNRSSQPVIDFYIPNRVNRIMSSLSITNRRQENQERS